MADFGFAKRLSPGVKTFTLCGTPEYLAPELVTQSGHARPGRLARLLHPAYQLPPLCLLPLAYHLPLVFPVQLPVVHHCILAFATLGPVLLPTALSRLAVIGLLGDVSPLAPADAAICIAALLAAAALLRNLGQKIKHSLTYVDHFMKVLKAVYPCSSTAA